ncbi:MAG: protein-disulfide reductase DsbD domain-containing protein, partial [Gammaproteobacteria bacterium]
MFLLNYRLNNLKFIWRWLYAIVSIIFLLTFNSLLADTQTSPLIADQAFIFSASAINDQTIVAHWTLAPTYYLYRDRIS